MRRGFLLPAAIAAALLGALGCGDTKPPPFDESGSSLPFVVTPQSAMAQGLSPGELPSLRVRGLAVRAVVAGLASPTTMAFIGRDDILVLQKDDGRVRRVVKGVLQRGSVLDVSVNSASERGLLGIAVNPDFPKNPSVFLYFTQSSGRDTSSTFRAPLGNRVYRYRWDGSRLVSPKLVLDLPATPGPNHDGGIVAIGPDGKLYAVIGELNQRGRNSNVRNGPRPDNAHLAGVILRVNQDGTAPRDNPFYRVGASVGGQAGSNIRKILAYGVRNSFGMAFDPRTGFLWDTENGEQTFDEINLVRPGFNSGWIQAMGPLSRLRQYKSLEGGLVDYNIGLIAETPKAAQAKMFPLPGSAYSDPEFSWRHAVAPTAIAFQKGPGLGAGFDGDMFVGDFSTGAVYRFDLNAARTGIAPPSRALADLVADNSPGDLLGEARGLVVGTGFGVVTDIETGPNGNLFVVSLLKGAIFEIHRTR